MRSLARRLPSGFELAATVAAACVAIALALAAATTTPSLPDGYYSFPLLSIQFAALSATAMVVIGFVLRSRQEASAYVALAAACLTAGGVVEEIWQNSVAAQQPMFGLALLFPLIATSAVTAVLAIFASTPPRRLERRAPLLLAGLVVSTVVAAGIQTWLDLRGWNGEYLANDDTGPLASFAGTFTSLVPVLVAGAAAALGSLRNEALRHTSTGQPAAQGPAYTRPMFAAFLIALVVSLLVARAGLMRPTSPEWTLLPLLAALIGIVAARWSAYVAWTALACSFGVSAVAIASAALDDAVARYVSVYQDDPLAHWELTWEWLIPLGAALAMAVLAVAAASRALAAARRARAGTPGRSTNGSVALVAVGLGCVAWLAFWQSLGDGNANPVWWEVPLRGTVSAVYVLSALLVVAAMEALRGRLVPAVAEAEMVARRPFRPLRYLETVAIEAVTARAKMRRSAMAAERSKLASDLHAELLPSLAEIAAQYEAGAPKEAVASRLRRLEQEVRDLMAERRLVILEEFGLVEAIEWLLGRAEERQSLQVELSVDDRTTSQRPPREVERAAFRIAQLAVENALQHAAPTRLSLDVLARADAVRLSVADDGRGLAGEPGDRARDHVGLADMRSQAADVRGDVQVVAPAAGGTTVTFAWPAA